MLNIATRAKNTVEEEPIYMCIGNDIIMWFCDFVKSRRSCHVIGHMICKLRVVSVATRGSY